MQDDSVLPRVYPQFSTPGNIQPYENERTLFKILAVCAILFWLVLTVLTLGMVWLGMAGLYLLWLVFMSAFTAHVRGNGVLVGGGQFPGLEARFNACCMIVGLKQRPYFYVLAGNGALNAFASRFLRRYYVVLLSDVVDALDDDEEALNFYIGHELGHISQNHLERHWWLNIIMLTPLLGAAYSRAREYTCDQYGLACCHNTASAMHALAVLAVGSKRWRDMDMGAFIAQSESSGGFWMSLNELTNDYPWLCKRLARVQRGDRAAFPRRHVLAWILAAFIPRTGLGLVGAVLAYFYLALILAGAGLPAYRGYLQKQKDAKTQAALSGAHAMAGAAAERVARFVAQRGHWPESLQQAGFAVDRHGPVGSIDIAADAGVLTVEMAPPLAGVALHLMPQFEDGKLSWSCRASGPVGAELLPAACPPQAGAGAD